MSRRRRNTLNDAAEVEENLICNDCVGEQYLSAEIRKSGKELTCSYCEETGPCIAIGDLAEHVESAVGEHYQLTSDQPDFWEEMLMRDPEESYHWDREGQDVEELIQEIADVSEDIAKDIQLILDERTGPYDSSDMHEEGPFSDTAKYDLRGPDSSYWDEGWKRFSKAIRTETRFFNRHAGQLLEEVFGNIAQYRARDGQPLVVDGGPDTAFVAFFRARVFQANEPSEQVLMRPDLELGPPPSGQGRAGRMNPQGVSVFYGALSGDTAVREVRPPVGSVVVTARFDVIRPIKLLNFDALSHVRIDGGSYFDPAYARRLGWAHFLRTLKDQMVRPVMPESEHTDYLETQAVADFLASSENPALDGILFPSVQSGAGAGQMNVVLFQKASKVASLDLPKGTKIQASTGSWSEDGWETRYEVREEVPPPDAPPPMATGRSSIFDAPLWPEDGADIEAFDDRVETLKISTDTVQVHRIGTIQVSYTSETVHRDRRVARPDEQSDF